MLIIAALEKKIKDLNEDIKNNVGAYEINSQKLLFNQSALKEVLNMRRELSKTQARILDLENQLAGKTNGWMNH